MIYHLARQIKIKSDIETAWNFFSSPKNLSLITPPALNFKIKSGGEEQMYPGMMITYKVHPIMGIPMTWVTEITQVKKPFYFVDEQRYGPYKMWHHQHRFSEVEGGVLVEDIVDYIMPFGPLGSLIHALIVKYKVAEIFDYREKVLANNFPTDLT